MKSIFVKYVLGFLKKNEPLARELVLLVLEHYIEQTSNKLKKESLTRVKNQWDK